MKGVIGIPAHEYSLNWLCLPCAHGELKVSSCIAEALRSFGSQVQPGGSVASDGTVQCELCHAIAPAGEFLELPFTPGEHLCQTCALDWSEQGIIYTVMILQAEAELTLQSALEVVDETCSVHGFPLMPVVQITVTDPGSGDASVFGLGVKYSAAVSLGNDEPCQWCRPQTFRTAAATGPESLGLLLCLACDRGLQAHLRRIAAALLNLPSDGKRNASTKTCWYCRKALAVIEASFLSGHANQRRGYCRTCAITVLRRGWPGATGDPFIHEVNMAIHAIEAIAEAGRIVHGVPTIASVRIQVTEFDLEGLAERSRAA
jgi:hypothetical protein